MLFICIQNKDGSKKGMLTAEKRIFVCIEERERSGQSFLIFTPPGQMIPVRPNKKKEGDF